MTLEQRVDKLEKRMEKLEEHNHEQDMSDLQKYNNLEKLIAKAVEEGIEKVMQKFEVLEKRITTLENAEANKALEERKELFKQIKQIVVTAIISFLAAILLNNFVAMISNNVNSSVDNNIEEVLK